MTGHTAGINAMAQINENQVATSSNDTTISVWDVTTGALIFTYTGHTAVVEALLILPNGYLASGGLDSRIRVWNLQYRQFIGNVTTVGQVLAMKWNAAIGKVIVSMISNKIGLFNATSRTFTSTWTTGTSRTYQRFDVLPDGRLVMVQVNGFFLDVFNFAATASLFTSNISPSKWNQIVIAPNNYTAVTGYQNGKLQLLDTTTYTLSGVVSCHGSLAVDFIQFTPDIFLELLNIDTSSGTNGYS
jgi:WD40 repeat protein